MILGDFHIHSRFSDGILSIPEIVDLFGQNGFGAIAITDHLCEDTTIMGKSAKFLGRTLTPDNFSFYMQTLEAEAERAWQQYEMVLIPGFELTKNSLNDQNSAHILALGVHDYIHADEDVPDLISKIHAQGALAIAAHPVDTRQQERQTHMLWNRREELSGQFDAWEVASGPHLFDEVLKTSLPKIANSDMHGPLQMRSWKTRLDCERHPQAVLEAIKKQNVDFEFFEPKISKNSRVSSAKVSNRKRFYDQVFDLSLAIF
jgi:hypothetical protein